MCNVIGCSGSAKSRGLCGAHYKRLLKYGDPTAGRRRNGEQLAWLHRHAQWGGDDCLEWPYYKYKDGYGRVRAWGTTVRAHRVMCVFAHGKPATNMVAAHSCDNKGCVNPAHLRWASAAENAAEACERGRQPSGEQHGSAKLTSGQVRQIRERRTSTTIAALAKEYGISRTQVSDICARKRWKHI